MGAQTVDRENMPTFPQLIKNSRFPSATRTATLHRLLKKLINRPIMVLIYI